MFSNCRIRSASDALKRRWEKSRFFLFKSTFFKQSEMSLRSSSRVDIPVLARRKAILGAGLREQEDGVVEIASLLPGEDCRKLHGTQDINRRDLNVEEEPHSVHCSHFGRIGYPLILCFDLYQEPFFTMPGGKKLRMKAKSIIYYRLFSGMILFSQGSGCRFW